jgi:predicted permease
MRRAANLANALKEGDLRSTGGAAPNLRRALLIGETALALVLVIAAGLLTQTFFRLLATDPGFRADHVLTFELTLAGAKYPDNDRIVQIYQRILAQLRAAPGVQSAGIAEAIPMGGAPESTGIRIPDHPASNDKDRPFAEYAFVSSDYFSAVGVPVLRGRQFLESDTGASPPVAVINQAMAKKYWPGEDPVGKRLALGSPKFPVMTVVGVVGDVKNMSLRQAPGPEMYVPFTQKPWPSMMTFQVALRTRADPLAMTAAAREAIRSADPDLPVAKVAAMTALVDGSMTQSRFAALVLGGFGALALMLAAVGMYGVISYSVRQRTREIGIRMALGAEKRNVLGMVLAQAASLAGVGVSIGLAAAFAATRIMAGYLYGVRATDPITFIGAAAVLVTVTLLACYVPARRATRVDPMVALREE